MTMSQQTDVECASTNETTSSENKPEINGVTEVESPKKEDSPKKEKDDEDDDGFKPITAGHLMDDYNMNRESRNRVKLYVLCEQRVWDDRGTGHVACVQVPGQQTSVLIVKLESADKNVLESKILMDTVYQKQQETLIVWSETETCDLALSFQEKSGCDEIWTKICEVQGRDPGDADGGFDDIDEGELSEGSSSGRVIIPPVEISRLNEIDLLINNHMASSATRERMATLMENEGTLPKLAEVFRMCEDLEHTEGLRTLYSIARNTMLLNRVTVQDFSFLELIFDEKHMKDFIGMLEYDPSSLEPKKHRDFLYEKARFREVIPLPADDIREKIHKVYRVQYIQDVCLPAPSLFEENLMGPMNSYLFFLRVEICNALQKDKNFIRDLFNQMKSADTGEHRRRDLVSFLKEFISMSQQFPSNGLHQKELVFKNLFAADVLTTIEPCITSTDQITRNCIIEICAALVDHSPQVMRDFIVKQAKGKSDEDVLLNRFLTHMLTDPDPELASANHVSNIMRTLMDPDNMVAMQKAERSEFLHLFYQRSIYALTKPMFNNVTFARIAKDDYCTANKQQLVVRLLCFCIEHHSFSMRQHMISSDLLNKVLVLLGSKHHFLSLAALKMLRTVLATKDDFYNRYIIRDRVLDKVVTCFVKNGSRYNLLNSAILELFEYIRTEDIKSLMKFVVENHMSTFESVTYVKVFSELKLRYEQQKDREANLKNSAAQKEEQKVATTDESSKQRLEEEEWFNNDEEEGQTATTDGKESQKEADVRKGAFEPPSPLTRKNAFDEDDSPVFSGQSLSLQHTDKKIVIKVGERAASPVSPVSPVSPSNTCREDEVSSSQTNGKESGAVRKPSTPLVDYDGSDSDEEENGALVASDAVPSSSTGSPTAADEAPPPNAEGSPVDDSVSSTSCENDSSGTRKGKRPSSEIQDDAKRRRSCESES